ncbi:18044_t:CDS:2 [Gigaspora margarita]|uniref:18044_t:CDS:1 n=1 Tax=Gigaspora margarita TaxID=4874 RepID=A0ABN7UK65_GIGMA|nr:18044_t:CDS:2 [Gigaspora margarita]
MGITNYKRFNHEKDFIHVAQCYGISQDPETKNYLMVMNYFKNGTLRQYLNENYEQLSLKDKLLKILIIKCWDDNPQDRPKIQELFPKVQELFHFYEWYFDQDSKFHQPYHQIEVAKKSLKLTAYNDIIYQTHPQAIYTSRLFDLNLISKTLNLET